MKKAKLTLNVDEEVVKRAKDLNINISEVTEMALRGFTTTKNKSEADAVDIRSAYDYLFRTMMPVMMRFDTTVEVGLKSDPSSGQSSTLYLPPDGKLYWWDDIIDEPFETTLDKVPLWVLHDPGKIVSDWLAKLKKAKEEAPERVRTIQLYSGIVDVMSKTLTATKPSNDHPPPPTSGSNSAEKASQHAQKSRKGAGAKPVNRI
jgi:hypothetical protein